MPRACSDTDLQGLFCVAADHAREEDQNAGQKFKCGCGLEKFSIIEERDQPPTDKGRPTEEDFQSASQVCYGMLASGGFCNASVEIGSASAFVMASRLSASSKADYLSEGNLGCWGGNGRGHDGPIVSSHGEADPSDLYYRKLLQLDPQNPLLLRNYAQYLSETKHDYEKSEEYYERAILACPSDGEVLSTYAKHLWDVHKDVERAADYFDQAVKAAPGDCYVLASHASFLWQSEEDEESIDVSQPVFPTPLSLTASA
ncbi:hypothetical protein GOP47_0009805 [Adiantum capillus-veneris]|uniref:Pre-mRNA-splicing factor Syf1/CRNKL1-like C-terminal HAT-repeats domain-containing protein n=1 Tax=Adiantum capillus-veneris TaxID=13818 RepID=A0A9D4ZHK2_ADICA|nr:hypothetical protein GOP47_0009805 [Adiantum capillus-veneris]